MPLLSLTWVHSQKSLACIPDRTITDNIFLICDVTDVCKCDNAAVDIVSLDQEKAFDRVDHSLLSALKPFGIGDGLLALLYRVQCMVMLGAGLSRPIAVKSGIRQGC